MECVRRVETSGNAHLIVRGKSPPVGHRNPEEWSGALTEYLRQNQSLLGIVVLEEMLQYLHVRKVNLYDAMNKRGLSDQHPWRQLPTYYLVGVPDGDIYRAMGAIYRFLSAGSPPDEYPIYVEPEPVLHIAATLQQSRIGTNFSLTAGSSGHASYKAGLELNLADTDGVDGSGSVVAVLDTGIEPGGAASANWHDMTAAASPSAADNHGHGTAMSMIVRDLAPGASVHTVRVTDSGSIYMWDLMAGILTAAVDIGAHVISMSLGVTDLQNSHCFQCGQGWNQSTTFKGLLARIKAGGGQGGAPDPILLAATGNDGDTKGFLWPAAFDSVTAVGAVTLGLTRPSFSNTGTPKQYFLCPGGDADDQGNPTEWVGEGSDAGSTTYCLGTSPATAYAAGLLALHRDYRRRAGLLLTSDAIVDRASNVAKPDVSNESGNVRLVYGR